MEPPKSVLKAQEPVVISTSEPTPALERDEDNKDDDGKRYPPLLAKLFAVLLISCISFGSHWSSGVTGAMKSTIKKVCETTLLESNGLASKANNAENGNLKHSIFSTRGQ